MLYSQSAESTLFSPTKVDGTFVVVATCTDGRRLFQDLELSPLEACQMASMLARKAKSLDAETLASLPSWEEVAPVWGSPAWRLAFEEFADSA